MRMYFDVHINSLTKTNNYSGTLLVEIFMYNNISTIKFHMNLRRRIL